MTALGRATDDRAAAWGLLRRAVMGRLSLVVLATLLCARSAGAACAPVTSANGLCSSMQGNTCFIDGKQCPVVTGSILDFGTKDVVFRQSSSLNVGTGTMTLKAKSLELQPGTALLGPGGTIIVQTTDDIKVLRPSQGSPARIDVADPVAADFISLASSGGTIQINGIVDARGTNTDGSGGSIDVTAANIVVSGEIRTSGGPLGGGGPLLLDAQGGSVNVSGKLDAFGGFTTALDIFADNAITTSGQIDMRSTAPGSDAAQSEIFTNSGSISLGGKIFMQGDEGTDIDGGGSGGELTVRAPAGALTVTAEIEATGAPPDGLGGELEFASGLDTVQSGTILAQGRGSQSDGGFVTFDSQKGLHLGDIDVHGSESLADTGGDLFGSTWCDLTVPPGSIIDARYNGGSITLQAGGQMVIAGALKAGNAIKLDYLTTPPVTSGASFSPPSPLIQQDTSLTPCGGIPLPSCGDGDLDDGEECDDDNTVSCDGCSSTCKSEECGNGRIDCRPSTGTLEACDPGETDLGEICHDDCSRLDNVCGDSFVDSNETCDAGDTNACDGCSATCQTESCGNGIVECQEECDSAERRGLQCHLHPSWCRPAAATARRPATRSATTATRTTATAARTSAARSAAATAPSTWARSATTSTSCAVTTARPPARSRRAATVSSIAARNATTAR
jgi:cysteine-rich repeat protein